MDARPTAVDPNYRLLLGSLMALSLLYPLIDPAGQPWAYGIILWRIVFWVVLYFALRCVRLRRPVHLACRGMLAAVVVSGALSLALEFDKIFGDQWNAIVLVITDGLSLFLLSLVTGTILKSVLAVGRVDGNKMWGAVCVYVLIGLIWTFLYGLVEFYTGVGLVSLSDSVPDPKAVPGSGDLGVRLYFSFVTLTTVGYGDIGPGHPLTRLLATSEALVGQLYLTVLVARLVALSVAPPHPHLHGEVDPDPDP